MHKIKKFMLNYNQNSSFKRITWNRGQVEHLTSIFGPFDCGLEASVGFSKKEQLAGRSNETRFFNLTKMDMSIFL
jgi:hypothetical protein